MALDDLLSKNNVAAQSAGDSLCDSLRRFHFAIVRLSDADSEILEEMWGACQYFYELSDSRKIDAAGPIRSECADPSLVVGYCAPDSYNEFLETRLEPNEELHPSELRNSGHNVADAFLAGRQVLVDAGLAAVGAAAAAVDNNVALTEENILLKASGAQGWRRLVDDGKKVPAAMMSSSVHRM